ncbi:hypothetical protein Q1695_007673 [Nippostrongylus brasiliensis]|nr:hypothetical protein Q1695_007673 [Nippostrongylus brasiliensis]
MQVAALLLVAGVAFAQYDTQPSGYGDNDAKHVQYVAGKSPRNKPVDYTKSNDFPGGGSNVIGNWFNQQNLGQANNQGQQSVQKGGDQTNVGVNSNAVNVGQTNNQGGSGPYRGYDGNYGGNYKPSYDAPAYGGGFPHTEPSSSQSTPRTDLDLWSYPPNGGAQANTERMPSMLDSPTTRIQRWWSYGLSNFIKNNVNSQNLGQTNAQGQSNVQQGGDQTNVGVNTNAVNVGQSNNQGAGPAKGYDAPRYGGYNPGSFFAGNDIFAQNLGQSNQGQLVELDIIPLVKHNSHPPMVVCISY